MHAPNTAWRVLLAARTDERSRAIASALRAGGLATVVEVESPTEGIRQLGLGAYDAVIANHPMRSAEGHDILETAQERHPGVRRIFLADAPTLETIVSVLQSAGIHAVLTGALGMSDVVRLVHHHPS